MPALEAIRDLKSYLGTRLQVDAGRYFAGDLRYAKIEIEV
jgi:hypothetical protein